MHALGPMTRSKMLNLVPKPDKMYLTVWKKWTQDFQVIWNISKSWKIQSKMLSWRIKAPRAVSNTDIFQYNCTFATEVSWLKLWILYLYGSLNYNPIYKYIPSLLWIFIPFHCHVLCPIKCFHVVLCSWTHFYKVHHILTA